MSDGEVSLSATYLRESEKAYCVRIKDENDARWIPKSVVTDITEGELSDGQDIDLFVKPWFAQRENLA